MDIQKITDIGPWMGFVNDINSDPAFSSPALATPAMMKDNLLSAVGRSGREVLGVLRDGQPAGLFIPMLFPEDRYLEIDVALSRSAEADETMLRYLREQYPGFHADFVINPADRRLTDLLVRSGARPDIEQQVMKLTGDPPPVDTAGIETLSESFRDQYLALHSTDCYWTGERVAEAADRFRVLLAVEDDRVVGYLDVTKCYDENEPYDLLVAEASRRKGWGRKLLARAIELNRPKAMELQVDVDNIPALRLYGSMGFTRFPGRNNVTVKWDIPEKV